MIISCVDAQLSPMGLQKRLARKAARQQREKCAVEARVSAALHRAATSKLARPDYLDRNYAGQRQQRQKRGAWRPKISQRVRRPEPGPERYAR